MRLRTLFGVAVLMLAATSAYAADPSAIDPAPKPADWVAIGKLPDWSGVWNPDITDQNAQIKTNPPPWTTAVASQIDALAAEEKAGHRRGKTDGART